MTPVDLKPLQSKHVDLLHAWVNHPDVCHQLLHDGISPEELRQRIDAPNLDRLHLAITDHQGVLVGGITLSAHPPPPCPWGSFELFIGPEHQGRGYGRQALEQVPDQLKAWRGLEVVQFGVFMDNAKAISLYEALGYETVETCWIHKSSGRRRALLMSNAPHLFRRRPIGFR